MASSAGARSTAGFGTATGNTTTTGGAGAQLLDASLAEIVGSLSARGGRPYAVDCGGGSGRRAVPLALHGAEVTVIDASIDALAILSRRATEAGVAEHVGGLQADLDDLSELLEPSSVDLVLVHDALGGTRDPAAVLSAAARAVAPGGYLSIVVQNPVAVVLARALAGDLDGALTELRTHDDPAHGGMDLERLGELVRRQGCDVVSTRGLDAISSMVPGSVLDGHPGAAAALAELDRRTAARSPYREIAGQLHLLASRSH